MWSPSGNSSVLASSRRRLSTIIVMTALWGLSSTSSVGWQEPRECQSVWDGCYTEEQAARGRDVYRKECGTCHGPSLAGGETGPSLSGSAFLEAWAGMSVGDLFDRISVSMPQEKPGTLSAQQYADIVARILEANRFPVADHELPSDPAVLKRIKLEAKPSIK